ncbi:hypothetical protein [Arcanobacterium hippocoleae]|uniref:Uncharacterized protein n=1 Tax=Arcanobacterium hippocoleae TaxID=149017 RepID=A0ABU1T3A6_9ACTO|nr:hypothetical protein [Arcanobacterium hippocoleae]MDR6939346.1 hypothetical protein [Arcanobacterium hippocoleae]
MSGQKPRRPAQLQPEQVELIQGDADTAFSSELAHASAQAIVPLSSEHFLDVQTIERVKMLIAAEGVDALAETWVMLPADTLPGILWRGYLLREWVRRFTQEVQLRYAASEKYFSQQDAEKVKLVARPEKILAAWNEVFMGDYRKDFALVLRDSARFCDFLGSVVPAWIADEAHPLATSVTLRDTAMLRVAQEFQDAAGKIRA